MSNDNWLVYWMVWAWIALLFLVWGHIGGPIMRRFERPVAWFKKRKQRRAILASLDPLARHFAEHGNCPDCRGDLLVGPSGGMCTNYKCEACGNKFNIGPMGFAERI